MKFICHFNFSFHEMGYYDCAAFIDYILNKTSKDSLTYIGHAQGATQFFILASTKPKYITKVNHMIAFAPFTHMAEIPHPIIQLLKFNGLIKVSITNILMLKYSTIP